MSVAEFTKKCASSNKQKNQVRSGLHSKNAVLAVDAAKVAKAMNDMKKTIEQCELYHVGTIESRMPPQTLRREPNWMFGLRMKVDDEFADLPAARFQKWIIQLRGDGHDRLLVCQPSTSDAWTRQTVAILEARQIGSTPLSAKPFDLEASGFDKWKGAKVYAVCNKRLNVNLSNTLSFDEVEVQFPKKMRIPPDCMQKLVTALDQ